jgi:hypothetical protein
MVLGRLTLAIDVVSDELDDVGVLQMRHHLQLLQHVVVVLRLEDLDGHLPLAPTPRGSVPALHHLPIATLGAQEGRGGHMGSQGG